jgi:hypothetical protein
MRTINFNEHTFKIEETWFIPVLEFTDHSGRQVKLNQMYLHDPELHLQLGFTTIRSVLKWWISNRDLLKEACGGVGTSLWDTLFYQVYRFFDHIPSDDLMGSNYEVCKESLSGMLPRESLSVTYNNPRITTSASAGRFLLCVEDEPEVVDNGPKSYTPTMSYLGNLILTPIETIPQATRGVETKWNKHYNYSFNMSSDDFNWFRSASKESSVFFGMELEISSKLTTTEIQYIITDVEPKQEPFFIFKQDGSISGAYDHRLELVTVPCTPRYLRKNWKLFFQKLERLAESKGKTISDYIDTSTSLTNGLHIHVSKDSFIDKSHSNKFLTAWHQWDEDAVGVISDAACRPSGYTDHSYCRIFQTYKNTSEGSSRVTGIPKFERQRAQRSLAKRLKGIRVTERATVAHDGNSATIEVRVYQGIFDIGHIMRSISFTEAMFEYCQGIGYSGFDANFARMFTSFIKKHSKFSAIHNIFKYNKGEQTQCA